jgi:hypothetical protein
MPRYANYDITNGPPYPVIGWYDTDYFDYDSLPDNLLQITDIQWQTRLTNAWWAVEADQQTLVESSAPITTYSIIQQAVIAIGSGLYITLSGNLAMSSTLFPTDTDTQNKLTAVVTTVTAVGAFPGGLYYYPMKDSGGAWHSFTVSQYLAVAGAISAYVSALYLIADGNPFNSTSLPGNSVSLVV